MSRRNSSSKRPSLLVSGAFLVAANLVPLVGAVWFGWDVKEIVLIYWFENLIIGLITILRIASAKSKGSGKGNLGEKVFLIPFFMVHYGGFCLAHLVFVLQFLGENEIEAEAMPEDGQNSGIGFWIAILALLASHLFSFFRNYIGRGEFQRSSPGLQMFAPYPRIIVLHIAIIFGAVGVERAGEPIVLLVILVIGKTLIDLGIHYLAHVKNRLFDTTAVS